MIQTGGAVLAAFGPLAETSKSSGSAFGALLPIVLLVGVFYMFIIRPQRNRARQAAENRRNVAPGVEVQTTFGMFATVIAVEDDAVLLEIAPGVHARFSPQVIGRVITPVDEETDGDEAEEPVGAADEVDDAPAAETSAPAKA